MNDDDTDLDLAQQHALLEELAEGMQLLYEEDAAVPGTYKLAIEDLEAKPSEDAGVDYLPGLSFVLRMKRKEASSVIDVWADGAIEVDDEPHPEPYQNAAQVWALLKETRT